jgi:hypothetical protein
LLQLYVYGNKFKGFLDLVPGTSLDMETLSELFDEELTLGEYSLPLDAPFTDNNKKILGNVEMLNSVPANETLYWRCDVWADGITVRTAAKLTLIAVNGNFSYDAGNYQFTLAGNKGLFGSAIAGFTLQQLVLDKISLNGLDARTFATNVMKQTAGNTQYSFMKFAPVAIENYFYVNRPDYNGEFLAQDIANNIVINGASWKFGRPTSADTTIAAAPGSAEYMDYRTIPFFTYKWICTKIFQQFGYTLTGDWVDDAAWDKAFMFNNFGIEQYDTTAKTDLSTYIFPAQHLPKKSIGTFLRDLQFFFCIKFSFLDGNIVRMDYRKSSLASKSTMDATAITGNLFNSNMLDYKEKGFTLAFNFDSADAYNGARVQAIDGKQLVATINNFTGFGALIIGRTFNYNDLVYVKAENQYYAYSNGSGTSAWEYFSEKLFPMVIGAGGYSYQTGISPMTTYLLYNPDIDKLINKDMAAVSMPGTYFNKNNTLVENPFEPRIFYIDMLSKSGVVIPASFVHNRDRVGQLRVPVSLAWDGDEGLYATLWKDWLNFLMNTRLVKASLSFNQRSYANFSDAVKIRINGTYYLPHLTTIKIPLQDAAGVELYRL